MRYTKITGTILQFQTGQRTEAGVHFSSQDKDFVNGEIRIITHVRGRKIATTLKLSGADALDFTGTSDDPTIPLITGRFLNKDYRESILSAALPEKNLLITGAVTQTGPATSISLKSLTNTQTGQIVAVVQEMIELISEDDFNTASQQHP